MAYLGVLGRIIFHGAPQQLMHGRFFFHAGPPVVTGVNNYRRIMDAEVGACLLIFPADEGRRHVGAQRPAAVC